MCCYVKFAASAQDLLVFVCMCVSVCVCLSTSECVFLSVFMFVCAFFAVHMSLREGVCAFVGECV